MELTNKSIEGTGYAEHSQSDKSKVIIKTCKMLKCGKHEECGKPIAKGKNSYKGYCSQHRWKVDNIGLNVFPCSKCGIGIKARLHKLCIPCGGHEMATAICAQNKINKQTNNIFTE